jgi:hypothetical protein
MLPHMKPLNRINRMDRISEDEGETIVVGD